MVDAYGGRGRTIIMIIDTQYYKIMQLLTFYKCSLQLRI